MKVSIAIPYYPMKDALFFLQRCLDSIQEQTFTDYEVVITQEGTMAENTNAAIRKCRGEIIKILYMDDYFAHDDALQEIVDNFKGGWLVTGCQHSGKDGYRYNYHEPRFTNQIHVVNTIGSPSVLTVENKDPLFFDENMTWMLDCDYYKRLHERYGEPTIMNDINVVIGVGDQQKTASLTEEEKDRELDYMLEKYKWSLFANQPMTNKLKGSF